MRGEMPATLGREFLDNTSRKERVLKSMIENTWIQQTYKKHCPGGIALRPLHSTCHPCPDPAGPGARSLKDRSNMIGVRAFLNRIQRLELHPRCRGFKNWIPLYCRSVHHKSCLFSSGVNFF